MTDTTHMLKSQAKIRIAFWEEMYPGAGKPHKFRGKRQNQLPADVRMAWVDFVDRLSKDKTISQKLASRVTL
jgi:hypothetical protein